MGAIAPVKKRIEVVFEPRTTSQKDILNNQSPNLLASGPWYAGKTHAAAIKAFMMAITYRNNAIALIRRKQVDLKATLWKKFVEDVLPPEAVMRSNDSDLTRKLFNGSEIVGVGMDSAKAVNKLASREFGFIVVEEAREIGEADFDEKITRCLRLPGVPFRQCLLITNPDSPAHFLYKRFFLEKWTGYDMINTEMLPDVPPDYQQRLDQLRGIFRERYKFGKWVAAEGLVYPFDPSKHLINSFEIPGDWRRIVAVDFGFDHPFVCAWYAISPDDIWYMYREIYMSNRIVEEHAKDIKKFIKIDCDRGADRPTLICDHDAEGSATLRSKGIATTNAIKARLDGQQTVFCKFENEQIYFFADALVEKDFRLDMLGRPTRTVEEFPTYMWANTAKEDMVKKDDDGMDTMRYAMHTPSYSLHQLLSQVETRRSHNGGRRTSAAQQAYQTSKKDTKSLLKSRRTASRNRSH